MVTFQRFCVVKKRFFFASFSLGSNSPSCFFNLFYALTSVRQNFCKQCNSDLCRTVCQRLWFIIVHYDTSVIFIHSRGQQINTHVCTHWSGFSHPKTFRLVANIYFTLLPLFQRRMWSMGLAIFSSPVLPVTLDGPTNDGFVSTLCCCCGDCSKCGCRLCCPAGENKRGYI